MSERESMPYDVVIVGAGAGRLAAAIRLKQLANEPGASLRLHPRKGLGGRRISFPARSSIRARSTSCSQTVRSWTAP